MSKVDMSVFEDVLEVYQGDSLSEMLYNMCEGDFGVELPTFKKRPEYPRFSLKESDPELYEKMNTEYSEVRDYNNSLQDKYLSSIGYKHLEQEGGGTGGAEECHGVFTFKGKYYRCHYSYYSYNGHEYDYIEDTIEEVEPFEKTVTMYRKIK